MHRGIISDRLEIMASRLGSSAYASYPDDDIEWTSFSEICSQIPAVVDESVEDDMPGFGALDDIGALAVASSVARGVHARLNHSYKHSPAAEVEVGRVLGILGAAEANYDLRLEQLHAAAASGEHDLAVETYNQLLVDLDLLDDVLRGVGLIDVTQRRLGSLGLRASDLARRFTMLLTGAIQVMRRMSTGRGAAGMKQIAENREQLRRYDTAQWQGAVPLGDLPEAPDQVVAGEVAETGWVDRPEIPYSFVRLADGSEVRIHRRDIKQNGVAPGSLIWVRGKVEKDTNGENILIAQFEGPGTHASSVWEDWLADEVRGAYDLYPRVIDANWEFPATGVRYSAGDVLSRVLEG